MYLKRAILVFYQHQFAPKILHKSNSFSNVYISSNEKRVSESQILMFFLVWLVC